MCSLAQANRFSLVLAVLGFSALFLSFVKNAFGISGSLLVITFIFSALTLLCLALVPVFGRLGRKRAGGGTF